MFRNWKLLLHLAIDIGCDSKHDHEQARNGAYDEGDESQHEKCPQDVDNQVHRIPPQDAQTAAD